MRHTRFLIAVMFLALAGCGARINTPFADRYPQMTTGYPRVSLFFDGNGDLYPDRWVSHALSDEKLRANGSLRAAGATGSWLETARSEQHELLRTALAGRNRVFVLIHGFNNDAGEAAAAFDMMEQRIKPGDHDAVVRVFWDGLIADPIAVPRIWFRAAGNSQRVGVRGLRPILNLLHDQKIVLVSHSRGASVVLSALSDPSYHPKFYDAAVTITPDLAAPAELRKTGGEIRAILLAPAVGLAVFWRFACTERARSKKTACGSQTARETCAEYRPFSSLIKSIDYTINPDDDVLRKKWSYLSSRFNATNLGLDEAVGSQLRACYRGVLSAGTTVGGHGHPFTLYARDPQLKGLLRIAGVMQAD